MADPVPASPPPYPRRFGWPMRLFLTALLFEIVFRSFSVCFPWAEWGKELKMPLMPGRLATRAEMEQREADGEDASRLADLKEALAGKNGVLAFFDPRPGKETREKLDTWPDRSRYAAVWLSSRLEFLENLVGFNEEWPMFSPNVSRYKRVVRARLFYSDGSEHEVRSKGDPETLTRYWHWNEEKVLDHELKVKPRRGDECFGYCNLLSHHYAQNPVGAPLVTIRLFMVWYNLPPPHVDAREWLAEQSGPPKDQRGSDFYEFDVRAREGRSL
jgi:hypothetical protein